ncbi:DedA family protein [Micromonospora sp. 4G55]|uniref:DedA family protein n=1 Tax=Micromonospora sp. 4G55 TaxID=2806102 RepID=UPI001EE4490C|nr:DedA family protein [Micromonospora sp. 4G55]
MSRAWVSRSPARSCWSAPPCWPPPGWSSRSGWPAPLRSARSSATPSGTRWAGAAAVHCWPGWGGASPRHLGPAQLARAEQSFARHGVWAVFFGRFVALLRILAGPLAGALHVPYRRFLVANAAGGLVWAFGTTYLLYSVGRAAEHWLKDISWAGLVLAVLAGLGSTSLAASLSAALPSASA